MKIFTKEGIKTYLTYYGWTILVLPLVLWSGFYFIFKSMYAPKKYEQLTFFYAAYGLKDNSLHDRMQKDLEADGCYEVNYYDYSILDKKIYEYYSALKDNCDFFVFSEHDLLEMKEVVKDEFKVLDEDLLKRIELPSFYSTYAYEDINYGIKLIDKDDDSYNEKSKFSSIINYSLNDNKDSFYLLINKDSENFDLEANHTLGYIGLNYLFNNAI